MKVTFWFLVAIGFVYAFYTGAVAIYSYYQVKDIVSETVNVDIERSPVANDAAVHGLTRGRR